jgi:hypothetical protein
MSYFLVNVKTGDRYTKPSHLSPAAYDTLKGAKTAATRLNKNPKMKANKVAYTAMDGEMFRKLFPVKMVKRRNLMSGKEYMEAEDTPLCCSPASETYWSM